MGYHAGAGHRCAEPHRDTQDRTEHQGTGAFTVSIADAAHIFCRFFSIIITRLSNKEKE